MSRKLFYLAAPAGRLPSAFKHCLPGRGDHHNASTEDGTAYDSMQTVTASNEESRPPYLTVKRIKERVQACCDVPAASKAVQVEALIQGTVRGHREHALVRTLGHTLLVTDCTGVESVHCCVTIQITTPAEQTAHVVGGVHRTLV